MQHLEFLDDGRQPYSSDLLPAVARGAIGRAVMRPDRMVHTHYVDGPDGEPMIIVAIHVTRTGRIHDVVVSG